MELPYKHISKVEWVETATGNKVSRNSVLCGSQNIILSGKVVIEDNVIVRGDFAHVRIGRFSVIRAGAVIRPTFKKFSKGVAFFPLHIGEHNYIGENCVLNVATIGSYCYIGKNCVIGRRCILKDCCYIADNSVIPPDTIIPSFSHYEGSPALNVGETPETIQEMMSEYTKSIYNHILLHDPKPVESRLINVPALISK